MRQRATTAWKWTAILLGFAFALLSGFGWTMVWLGTRGNDGPVYETATLGGLLAIVAFVSAAFLDTRAATKEAVADLE
jgi:hypothetical protein